jgi:hypothetical protein
MQDKEVGQLVGSKVGGRLQLLIQTIYRPHDQNRISPSEETLTICF